MPRKLSSSPPFPIQSRLFVLSLSFLLPRQNPVFGKFEARDSLENDGLWDVYNKFAMGNCGEAAAEEALRQGARALLP